MSTHTAVLLVDRFQNNEAKPDQSASVPSEEVMVKPWPTREDCWQSRSKQIVTLFWNRSTGTQANARSIEKSGNNFFTLAMISIVTLHFFSNR